MDVQVEKGSKLNVSEDADTDDNTQQEPVSLEEKHDQAMVETTSKRKTYPRKIRINLTKQYNSDVNQLVQCKFNLEEQPRLKYNPDSVCTLQQGVTDRARTAFSSLAPLSESASMLVDRAECLEKSYRLYATLADCPTYRALHSPQERDNKMATDVTPPRLSSTSAASFKPCNLVQASGDLYLVERTLYKDISFFQRRSTRLKQTD